MSINDYPIGHILREDKAVIDFVVIGKKRKCEICDLTPKDKKMVRSDGEMQTTLYMCFNCWEEWVTSEMH